ncbi:hypothetical protein FXF51_09045 [Nonomuraea sp. PA05]|uniref:hypothetical protein n=1 Tax=Nonomuraea sp. PA05 TaxID=2604466 RepID=UPI0011D65104|nr:hypothetical protein [Nonomuraea sp. PA05]TYB69353.1 hypothetical protein FXF51_09045 [Nonomuraea sp. PA05]
MFVASRDLTLVAGAGSGKNSALKSMGASTRKRGLYMAFNKMSWYASTGRPSGRATTATAWRSVSRVGSIF